MTKRFLFVCGGTGRTLVEFGDSSIFDWHIHIDQTMYLSHEKDKKMWNFGIPCSEDKHVFNSDIVRQLLDEMKHTRDAKKQLLSLLQTGGIGELNSTTMTNDSKTIPSVHEYVLSNGKKLQDQIDNELIVINKKIAFCKIILRDIYPIQIGQGDIQPLFVFSAYFCKPNTKQNFRDILEKLNALHEFSEDTRIELAFISSMAGGTGQGITQHVAQQAGTYYASLARNVTVRVQLLRIGSLSFNKIGAALNFRTHTNTAMAVLHDAGFAYQNTVSMQRGSNAIDGDESNRIDYQYIYLDAPDFGQNNALRQRYIANASTGVMHPEVQQALQKIYSNSAPIDWFRGVFMRVGTWENEIDSQTVYHEALESLRTKIALLLRPNYRLLAEQLRSRMQPNADLLNWHVAQLVELKEPTKTKSKLSTLNLGRYDRDSVAEYVRSQDFMTKWHKMSAFLEDYVGMADKLGFNFDIWIGPIDPRAALTPVTFPNQIAPKHSAEYLHNVTRAYEVRSFALQLLAGSEEEPGILARLFIQWNAMVPGIFDGNRTVDTKIRNGIKAFVETYLLVRTLISIVEKSDALLIDVRDWLAVLVDFSKHQLGMMPVDTNERLTHSVELTDLRDNKTWLASVHATLVGNLQSAMVVNNFKSAVVWGVSGVTQAGLRHVISLPTTATAEEVVIAVNSRAGRIFNNGVFEEAPWWQGQQFNIGAEGQFDFSYRIFPSMASADRTTLLAANKAYARTHGSAPEYVFESQPSVGLAVLAVECIRPHGSLVTPLLTPLLPSIQRKDTDRNEDGYIQRLAGSSIGEPIYMTDALHTQITGGKVDLRNYFVTVGPDEVE